MGTWSPNASGTHKNRVQDSCGIEQLSPMVAALFLGARADVVPGPTLLPSQGVPTSRRGPPFPDRTRRGLIGEAPLSRGEVSVVVPSRSYETSCQSDNANCQAAAAALCGLGGSV